MGVAELVNGVLYGDKRSIARMITLIENEDPSADEALSELHRHTGRAHVIGITGAPGVGKSCLVGKLVREYRRRGKTVGVVAVDPTSPLTGGALLGDRLRMQEYSPDPDVFIRSVASRGGLGGLAKATSGVIKVLDAAGKDVVLVETVGAGQSQVDIAKYVQTVVVVVMPMMGDSVQAMKAGLYEVADIFVVNKADLEGADMTALILEEGLSLIQPERRSRGWKIPIVKTVATTGAGVPELVDWIEKHREYMASSGRLREWLEAASEAEVVDTVVREFGKIIAEKVKRDSKFRELVTRVATRELGPEEAAREILEGLGLQ